MSAILETGNPLPFQIKSANLDLPELQGEVEAIARDKCKLAAQQVRQRHVPKCCQRHGSDDMDACNILCS